MTDLPFLYHFGLAVGTLLVGILVGIKLAVKRGVKKLPGHSIEEQQTRTRQVTDVLDQIIREVPGASRAYLVQVKNGELFDTGNPFTRKYRTHERCAPGVRPQEDQFDGVLISMLQEEIDLVLESGPSFTVVEQLQNCRFKSLCELGRVKAVMRCRVNVFDSPKAFVGVDFNFTDTKPPNEDVVCECATILGLMLERWALDKGTKA